MAVVLCCCATSTAQQSWTAKWIQAPWSTERDGAELDGSRPMPAFRRQFTARPGLVSATLRIAGLGQYEASINGAAVAPNGLHQAWTNYRKTVTYDSLDLTKAVRQGENVLSVLLGNGMYNVQRTKGRYTKFEGSFGVPKLTAELRLKYVDGAVQIIASDQQWRVAPGPIVFSSTYGGEDFNARRIQQGWELPGFSDASWASAMVTDGPGGRMVPAIAPDVREVKRLAPISTRLTAKRIVFDFGQNFTGWPMVLVSGPPGAVLRLTPGELLNPDGTVSQRSSGAPQWWSYTTRGDPQELWQPRFSFYGFRYVQAEWVEVPTAANGDPDTKILDITGVELSSASPVTGSFESSNEMLNAIHALIVNAMHNNELSLFTDCPHREKLGWLEETHLIAPGLLFNNDLHGLYAATEQNIADAQHPDGEVPTIAPQFTVFGTAAKPSVFDDSPEWGSASVLGPWAAYRFYGDVAQLRRSYPTMQAYVKFLEGKAHDGIVAYGLGDWYDIGPGEPGVSKNTSLGVTGTLMLYEDAVAMQKIATLLGQANNAASYRALAEREKIAFNTRYWNATGGFYDKDSQTANAMPLALGIVPEEQRAALLQRIVADIHAHGDHITTGEVGYPYLLRALMQAGRSDVLLAMLLRKDPPSYGSQLAAGATALTEAWDANPRSSQDHFMLGGAEEWFYRGLGGIDLDMSRPASERITIRPRIVDGVAWVKCGYASTLGDIKSDWNRTGAVTTLSVTIPAGAQATVAVPVRSAAPILLGQTPAERAPHVTLLRRDRNEAVYRVQSGVYRFTITDSAQ